MGTGLRKVILTRSLIYLNAAIWFSLALLVALDLHPAVPDGPLYRWGMAALALVAGSTLIALYRFSRRSRLAYFLLLGLLAMISLLSITDEFGLADLIVLIINLLAMVLLVVNRDDYL